MLKEELILYAKYQFYKEKHDLQIRNETTI